MGVPIEVTSSDLGRLEAQTEIFADRFDDGGVPVSTRLPAEIQVLTIKVTKELFKVRYVFRCLRETPGTLKEDCPGP